jgi:hypothetical protein
MRASFALDASTSAQTVSDLAALGDDPMPKLRPGGPVRWLGTTGQLKHTARDLGLPKHFFYAIPGKGFTLGQYVLGHVGGATAVSPTARFGGGANPPSLDKGDIIELVANQNQPGWLGAVDSLVGKLRDRGLEAVPVATLVRGRPSR